MAAILEVGVFAHLSNLAQTLGDFPTALMAALAGAMWPLAYTKTTTRRDGVLLLLRVTSTSVIFTGIAVWSMETKFGVPASKVHAPVAWALAAFGDNWWELIGALKKRALSFISGSKENQ